MKIKAAILGVLIVLGIIMSLYVYFGIVEHRVLSAASFFIAFLLTAMFSAKIMAEFRQLNKYVSARNKIKNILLPVTGNENYASILADNLVLHKTEIENWTEMPKSKIQEITIILKSIKTGSRRA